MTIVCAIHDGRETWIASDSRANDGHRYFDLVEKVIIHGEWALCCAGDYRTTTLAKLHAGKLLGDGLDGPEELTGRLRDLFDGHGYDKRQNNVGAPDYGQAFILARPGKVWDICPTLSIIEYPPYKLLAVGLGCEFAAGAAFVAGREDLPHQERARLAVMAACVGSTGCGGQLREYHLPSQPLP